MLQSVVRESKAEEVIRRLAGRTDAGLDSLQSGKLSAASARLRLTENIDRHQPATAPDTPQTTQLKLAYIIVCMLQGLA